MSSEITPLGAVARGVAAGVVGTAMMTISQELVARLQSTDDEQEQGAEQQAPQDPWEQASMPAQVGRRISEGIFHKEVSPDLIPVLTHAMHWAYGTSFGVVYGVIQGSVPSRPLRHGLLFGPAVMAMSYLQLVPMGIYEPPWKYSAKDLGTELGFHLAYGLGIAGGYRAIAGGSA